MTSWKTPSPRLSWGHVSTRRPAENRSGGTEERPTCGKGARAALRGLGGGAQRARLGHVHLPPCSGGLLSPALFQVVPSQGHTHIQAGGSREQAAQIHPGRPRVTPTAPGSELEGAWELLSGTCPTQIPSLLCWHTYYWLHARLQAG